MEALNFNFKLPLGFFTFHPNRFLNYQMNRWYSLGYMRREDINQIAKQIKNFNDFSDGFINLAKKAIEENRLKNAAFYYRAAEFLLESEHALKLPLYNDFINTFYLAFKNEGIQRHKIPYDNDTYLPAIYLPSRSHETKGTILGFGGFDSFMEEFYCIWNFFAHAGYDVIAFDGPGQGGALRDCGLAFDHNWEKPCRIVLDHFKVDKASCLGISMGGYWAMRAAAFEKRIDKVIAFPPVYDWLELTNNFNRHVVTKLMAWPNLMSLLISIKMCNGMIRHTMNQAMSMVHSHEPIDGASWFLAMNKDHIHSELVDQDVLLLCGENDIFQPPKLLQKQKQALVNARSITTRVFTKEEQADQHCQIGNLGLALEIMLQWLINPIPMDNETKDLQDAD